MLGDPHNLDLRVGTSVADEIARLNAALSDRYTVLRQLGSGGMSTVYLAQDLKHDREVAIKILRQEVASSLGSRRFLQEIQIAAKLSNPRIVPLFDSGEADGILYYVMPCVEGESLRDLLNREGAVPLERALRITKEVAAALSYAHEQGVVHCDIKPENILLSTGGAVVTDFGIAQALSAAGGEALTLSGFPVGTMGYMSPEQAMGSRELSGKTDVYSLGCVLYELLSGQPPGMWFDLDGGAKAGTGAPAPPMDGLGVEVPDQVRTALEGSLCLRPSHRTPTPEEFVRVLHGDSVRPRPSSTGGVRSTVMVGGWNRTLRWVGLAMVVVVVGALAVWGAGRMTGPTPIEHPRLSILPFENRGSEADAHLADGTAVAIRNRLAGLSGMDVIAYYPEEEFSPGGRTIPSIGAELGVDYVLRGAVQREGEGGQDDRMRVNVELIRTGDGTILWAAAYEEALTEIFRVQGEIAERVAVALDLVISDPELQVLGTEPTASPEAWSSFAQGNHFFRRSQMLDDNRRALLLYQRAVEIDSTFALAYAALARAHLGVYGIGEQSPGHLDSARVAIARSLQLEPSLPEGELAQAELLYLQRDYTGALDRLTQVIRARPSNFDALFVQGLVFRRIGRWEEAVRSFQRLVELNPRERQAYLSLGRTHLMLRDYAQAEEYLDLAMSLRPDLFDTYELKAWLTLSRDGDVAAAESLLTDAAELIGVPNVVAELAASEVREMWFGLLGDAFGDALVTLDPDLVGGDRWAFYLARASLHEARGDTELTHAYFDSLRMEMESRVGVEPEFDRWHALLGTAYAGIGRGAEALAQGERAVALRSVTADTFEGAANLLVLARICVAVGEYDRAASLLEELLGVPSRYSARRLAVHPYWIPLRSHPLFQRLLTQVR